MKLLRYNLRHWEAWMDLTWTFSLQYYQFPNHLTIIFVSAQRRSLDTSLIPSEKRWLLSWASKSAPHIKNLSISLILHIRGVKGWRKRWGVPGMQGQCIEHISGVSQLQDLLHLPWWHLKLLQLLAGLLSCAHGCIAGFATLLFRPSLHS